MASNFFGQNFRITTWGESHGKAIGVVIDGCPSMIPLSEADIQPYLDRRWPRCENGLTSSRAEKDQAHILSGVFEGVTTGAPIMVMIENHDCNTASYDELKGVLRPGHANYTYLKKYGVFDWRGGGRASARETACRVIGGAVADKILKKAGIHILSCIRRVGDFVSEEKIYPSSTCTALFCLTEHDEKTVEKIVRSVREEGDSIGGIVETVAFNVPVGQGAPIYGKLSAKLAEALMSIPGARAFEIGRGCEVARMRGSECNDTFCQENGEISMRSNNAGGILGGISTGQPIIVRTTFKPTSTIGSAQKTVSLDGKDTTLVSKDLSRHDACIALRAPPVCSAMVALVLADAIILNQAVENSR